MKIRNGFVSNSSSSSFIIGIGKVTDERKLRAYTEKHNLKYELTIKSLMEFEPNGYPGSINRDSTAIIIESFTGAEAEFNVSSLPPLQKIVILRASYGDESDFWREDWEEYDYDIDMDFFPNHLVDFCTDPESCGVSAEGFEYIYGAGRDG